MKISADVETEAHLYNPRETDTKQHVGKGGLKWRIDVSMAEAAPSLSTISEEATEAVTRLPASSVTRARVSRVSRVDLNSAAAETAIRKLSSTSELIERMGRGRKVITDNPHKYQSVNLFYLRCPAKENGWFSLKSMDCSQHKMAHSR